MPNAAKPETLASALVAFQAEAPHISLDGTNPHFNSKFATLAGVMNAVRPVLAKHGLALSQHPTCAGTAENPLPALRTTLLHVSGEREEDVMLLSVDKPGPQAQGSALTYARRYATLSILGLVGDEDDDANSAETSKGSATAQGNGTGNGQGFADQASAAQKKKLEELTKMLLDGGHITQEQLDSATKDAKPDDLLGRLERYAKQVGATA